MSELPVSTFVEEIPVTSIPMGAEEAKFYTDTIPAHNQIPDAISLTVAMASEPPKKPRHAAKPATGKYRPAFPVPARAADDEANEVFDHYRTHGENPDDDVNAHPAMTEVDNPDKSSFVSGAALGRILAVAMAETTGDGGSGPAEKPQAASDFYNFPPEKEEDRNAKPAMTDVPSRETQQRQQGRRNRAPQAEIALGQRASRLKKQFLAAIGSIGVGSGPTPAY
jgi:hypothetical protein